MTEEKRKRISLSSVICLKAKSKKTIRILFKLKKLPFLKMVIHAYTDIVDSRDRTLINQ